VAHEIRQKILVRSQVEIVDYGSLPRTQRKSKRVFDERSGISNVE
jgi:phenylacetate-CoA ligase